MELVEIDKTAVEVNRLYTDFTIKYTAAAEIEGAYFMVTIPTETAGTSRAFMMPDPADDTQLIALTLTDKDHPAGNPASHPNPSRGSSRYGTVQPPSGVRQTLIATSDTGTDTPPYDTFSLGSASP